MVKEIGWELEEWGVMIEIRRESFKEVVVW